MEQVVRKEGVGWEKDCEERRERKLWPGHKIKKEKKDQVIFLYYIIFKKLLS